jgi:hypothetical protein
MNDLILTAERREEITDLFNEITCSMIMTEAMSNEATALGHKARSAATREEQDDLYRQSREKHERWVAWWNDGHKAAEKLRGMGFAVTIFQRPARA